MDPTVHLITGAFGALGSVVSATLAAQGAQLVLVGASPTVPPDAANAYASHLLLPGVDLTRADAAEAALAAVRERYGRLTGVVNIAGGFRWERVADGSTDTWDAMYAMNVKTALNTSRAALPLLREGRDGRIVNIGAGAAAKAAAGMGAYAASKAGVQRLTEALAEELKDSGITVNAVLPSTMDTPANRRDMPDADPSRWVLPQSVAELIAYLLSPSARDITGAAIAVNGRV